MGDIESTRLMNREWQAWQAVIGSLHNLGYTEEEINGASENMAMLMDAMRWWGEELVALRVNQPPELRDKILGEAQLAYNGPGGEYE